MLELKNISFSVEEDGKQIDILKDVSLTVDDRKFIVITGPNGSGKSTLARIIAGIEKPTAGRILFDGEDITEKNITERARMGVAFAFQQPVRFRRFPWTRPATIFPKSVSARGTISTARSIRRCLAAS